MKSEGIDDIAKHLSTMTLNFKRNSPMVAAHSAVSASSSLVAFSCRQTLNCKVILGHDKDKENTPPRVGHPALPNRELDVPLLELPKAANGPTVQERKVRRWKLKHRTSIISQHSNEQLTRVAVQSESFSSSPPLTSVSWANLLSDVLLKTPSPLPAPSAHHQYLQSPPKPSRMSLFDEDTSIDMPKMLCLTPDGKTAGGGRGCPLPRRPTLKPRRRPIGRPSPLHKRARRRED